MSVSDDLNNPNLFTENEAGVYTYTDGALGKTASGQLAIAEDPQRDAQAQREAGGEDRRTEASEWGKDDGGHLIGARFGGATDEQNLTPQNSNLNRGAYKRAENSWAEHLAAGDKVYVHMESYTGGDSQRPSNYMGYAIIEHTDENGQTSRTVEYYSFDNESRMTQDAIDKEVQDFYESNPEYAEEQASQNTTMEYIWDEEKGEAVKNPHYDPNAENKTEAEAESAKAETGAEEESEGTFHIGPLEEQDPNVDHSHDAQNGPNLPSITDYGPEGKDAAEAEASAAQAQSGSQSYDVPPDAGAPVEEASQGQSQQSAASYDVPPDAGAPSGYTSDNSSDNSNDMGSDGGGQGRD